MNPKSKKVFCVSGSKIPNKTRKGKAVVTASALNVRCWPGQSSALTKFSPVVLGQEVDLCDAKLSEDGKPWFYIRHDGHYGFASGYYLRELISHRQTFINKLGLYSDYIKAHPKNFHREYDSDLTTFAKAKARVKAGKKVGITCVVPIRWALDAMKIKRADGKSLIVATKGTFDGQFNGNIPKYLKWIKGVNKKVRDADLRDGDIVCFKGKTHTCVYSGRKWWMFDGGRSAQDRYYFTGILLDYTDVYKGEKISEILRWKD